MGVNPFFEDVFYGNASREAGERACIEVHLFQVFQPLAHGEDTARLIPHARLEVIEGMGHDLPHKLMPQMVSVVAEFCHAQERQGR